MSDTSGRGFAADRTTGRASGPETVPVELTVNGRVREGRCEARTTLVDFLRDDLNLTGTHVGCEHGICGACTVIVDGAAVRSCLLFAVQAQGAEITTVEGLAENGEMSHVQTAFWESHGFQCGFCTPGFVMTTHAFLQDNPEPTEPQVREALSGNLCRCTGYQSIVQGVMTAAEKLRAER